MTSQTEQVLKNIARGQNYQQGRVGIFRIARELGREGYKLPTFLRDKLFKLEKDKWFFLGLDKRDWQALEAIREHPSLDLDEFYLAAVLDYIVSNAERIDALYEVQARITEAFFNNDAERAYQAVNDLKQEDRQSLFALRTASSQLSFSGEQLETYLRQTLRGEWLKKRFLYPLIFYAINQPIETNLDDFISFIVTGEESAAERVTIRFLLRDDVIINEPLAFKLYLALMCHPYDACEILLNHIELELCKRGTAPRLNEALATIASKIKAARPNTLRWLFDKDRVTYIEKPIQSQILAHSGLDAGTAAFLCSLAETKCESWIAPPDDTIPETLRPFARMRASKYPDPSDFELGTSEARFWWFTTGGRVLNALVTSLYLMPRTQEIFEVRDALRLVTLFGGVTPLALSSPSGATLLRDHFPGLRANGLAAELLTDRAIMQPEKYLDRMWIKALHWHLRLQESRPIISTWLQVIRRRVRVAPAYISGVSWDWVDGIIQKLRLKPFRGNVDGVYVLLLQKIEQLDRRTDAMRVAIEPFVKGKTLPEFMDSLIEEYDQEAIAFARFLLTPEDILLLGLAPNHTAALAARIQALETCIRKFKYTELLSQDIFAHEWNSLNSTLLLLSVNAGQFEIPWGTFEKDAAVKQNDLYTAAYNLRPGADRPSILTEARVRHPFKFRNGKVVTYVYTNKEAPIFNLILRTFEDFLTHPGFGIEVLLSTRFRHDTMRREFANTLTQISEAGIPYVLANARTGIVSEVTTSVLTAVDAWLQTYMQTRRPERPDGLFDLLPDSEEMSAILKNIAEDADLNQIISVVVGWIRARLDQSLEVASSQFKGDLSRLFEDILAMEKVTLLADATYRAMDVERVISAILTALQRRIDELLGWFQTPSSMDRVSLTFEQLRLAADGLFEASRRSHSFKTYYGGRRGAERPIHPDKVRLCFDLLRELFASALREAQPFGARVRISPITTEVGDGFRFSNLAPKSECSERNVDGHPYVSLDDVIFREGRSGLPKVASLSASIFGDATGVRVVRRPRSFHIFVLLWPKECPTYEL